MINDMINDMENAASGLVSLHLHEGWKFRDSSGGKWRSATVPGSVHSDLLRHEVIPDPFHGRNELGLQWIEETDWDYRCVFTVGPELLGRANIDLVFECLDTVATVVLNGTTILRAENMFQGYRLPVQGVLRRGRNTLEIRFGSAMEYIRTKRPDFHAKEFNDPVGGCYRIRKQQCQFGWDWGPRLVTCGIRKPVRLEAWSGNRIAGARIVQHHAKDGVTLEVFPELASKGGQLLATVTHDGSIVSTHQSPASSFKLKIPKPKLWWPAGQGDQPLYEVKLELLDGTGRLLDAWSRRIGLRTITLDRGAGGSHDRRKENAGDDRFGFRVNGRLIFAKGANWIPAHAFDERRERADYEALLQSAIAANMNMIRIWGGGVYEASAFYDLCDELGLLVWQDFMFACCLYPADRGFLDSVEAEARHQVQRLRHHACLALWCGNNESISMNVATLAADASLRRGYANLFLKLLPAVVSNLDPATPYLHSSPAYSLPGSKLGKQASHDEHDWEVWHARKPVEHYLGTNHRFVSEFGMQSYPSPGVAATFCPPEEMNVFSPAFENHQKNSGGNQIILDYISRRYRFPKDYRSLAYLSHLNQAWCLKVGVEHFRRQQPHCLGALYWQLNDCWPVASWSSLEFGGKWKALHYAARRFFAPSMASVHVHGGEQRLIGNYRHHTTGRVDLWTIHDLPTPRRASLEWRLLTLDGERLDGGRKAVVLRPGESRLQVTLDYAAQAARMGHENMVLRVMLHEHGNGGILSDESILFAPPRAVPLVQRPPCASWKRVSPGVWSLTLRSDTLHLAVWVDPANNEARVSDNFFDLHAGEAVTVQVTSPTDPRTSTTIMSLVDSYSEPVPI